MSPKPAQLRGHCPYCMRQQAVVGGNMAKHGYTVEDRGSFGWLRGVCPGQHAAPIEHDRTIADDVVSELQATAESCRTAAGLMRRGDTHPETCRGHYSVKLRDYEQIPWVDATPRQRAQAAEREISRLEVEARSRDAFAAQLAQLVERVHGKPLIEVARAEGPEPIRNGDRRTMPNGRIATATAVFGGKVRWFDERGFRGSCNTRTWRLWAKTP